MLCVSTYAQRDAQPKRSGSRSATPSLAQKNHSFFLGVKGGIDISTMTQPDECNLYDAAGLGFNAGVVGKVRFNRATPNAPAGTGLLGAGVELKYKQNTVKTIGTNEKGEQNAKLSVGYFEVPVYVHVYPFYKSDVMNTFYVEAGPDFAGTMTRSPKSLTVETPGERITYNIEDGNTKLKGMDVRIMAGIGYDYAIKNEKHETTNLVGVNMRYYIGTSKLAGNFNSKMNTLEISLSWMFNIGKL